MVGDGVAAITEDARRRVLFRSNQGDTVKKGTFLLAALLLGAWAAASPNGGPLGDFEAHGDVGSPKIAGYAT